MCFLVRFLDVWVEGKEGFHMVYSRSVLITGWGPHVSRKDHTSHEISFPEVLLWFYE